MPYNLRKRAPPERPVEPAKKRKAKEESTEKKVKIVKKEKEKEKEKETKDVAKEETIVEKKTTKDVKKEKEPKIKLTKRTEPKEEPEDFEKLEKLEESKELEEKKLGKSHMTFGCDSCGELGLGKIGISRKQPTLVDLKESIRQIVCGPMHTLSLTESGKIYSFGCNDEGALGRITDGDELMEATPTEVPLESKVIKVTAGDSHTVVLTEDNKVFVWGNFRDEHGSVGLTPECNGGPTFKPIQVLSDTKLTDVASGSNHVLLLDSEGCVYSFGVGAQGQLGRLKQDCDAENNLLPLTAENRELFLTPQKIDFSKVDPSRPFICDAIFAGNFSSFATNTDKKKNRLASWGLNNYFQLGRKGLKGELIQHFPKRSTFTCSTSMINVACGQHHTLFLTKTGRLYAAGRHEYGMLGLGEIKKEVCPAMQVKIPGSVVDISAGINTSFAVNDEGKLFSWGMGGLNLGIQGEEDLSVPTEVTSLEGKKVASVSAGGSFTSVLVVN